jgi:hypothetical protein
MHVGGMSISYCKISDNITCTNIIELRNGFSKISNSAENVRLVDTRCLMARFVRTLQKSEMVSLLSFLSCKNGIFGYGQHNKTKIG